jgi:protein arginine kinase activator
MLCQSCNQKEASVHITKIINGVKTEMHLCDECAEQQDVNLNTQFGFGMPMSFQDILEGFFEAMGGMSPHVVEKEHCPVCNMTFDDFRRTGRFGCSNCYKTFNRDAVPIVKRIHGNIKHTGKVPGRTGGVIKIKRNIENLKEQLKTAINNEEYEKAAALRDEIRNLESKLNEQEK